MRPLLPITRGLHLPATEEIEKISRLLPMIKNAGHGSSEYRRVVKGMENIKDMKQGDIDFIESDIIIRQRRADAGEYETAGELALGTVGHGLAGAGAVILPAISVDLLVKRHKRMAPKLFPGIVLFGATVGAVRRVMHGRRKIKAPSNQERGFVADQKLQLAARSV